MKKTLSCLLAFVMAVVAMQAASPSGTLPVLHIDTENNAPILTKTDYVKATYWLDTKGIEGVSDLGTTEAAPFELQIRGRGNYTWTGFNKKPYRLKLGTKQPLLGLNKSKHFGLLAHADDNRGFLRNAVGFQLSRLIGLPWTPGDQPVEVVLNGDYIGLYFLTETVRVDKTRVNVYDYDGGVEDAEDDLAAAQEALAAATDENRAQLQQAVADAEAALTEARNAEPAWLVEIDNYDDDDQIKIKEEGFTGTLKPDEEWLRVTYDSPSDYITEDHRQWLINEMTEVNRLIYDSDKSNCQWAEKVDLTDLAKFFVVNQIVFNYESFHGSCKLYRDNAAHAAKMGTDTKWHFSPVWDFGSSFQGQNTSMMLYNQGEYHSVWIEEMMKFPAFRSEVERVYAEFMDSNFNEIYDYIDSFTDKIQTAARNDRERWKDNGGYGNENPKANAEDVKTQLNNSINYLKSALHYNGGGGDDVDAPTSAIYLRGNVTEWNASEEYKFTDKGNNIYTLNVASLSGEWKLAGPEWNVGNVDFGGATGVKLDTPVTLSSGGGNCTLADQTLTDLTLTFNWATKELTVTAQGGGGDEPDPDPEYPVLYLRGAFGGSSWPALDEYKFSREGDIYTLNVASINGAFKIADADWTQIYNFGAPVDGSVIKLNESYKLQRGIDDNCETDGTFTNVIFTFDYATQTLKVTGEGGGGGDEPDLDNFVVYYHDKSENPWETVCVYMWKGDDKPAGRWPGTAMTLVQSPSRIMARVNVAQGEKLWKYEHGATLEAGHSIIFNNNDNGSQTGDWKVNGNNHVYASDGNGTSEIYSGGTTGIENTEAAGNMQITASNGTLKVVSATDCVLVITRIDGVNFTLEVVAGENTYTLPRGFYIAAGRKFAL